MLSVVRVINLLKIGKKINRKKSFEQTPGCVSLTVIFLRSLSLAPLAEVRIWWEYFGFLYIVTFKEHCQVSVMNFFRQAELRESIVLVILQGNQKSKTAKIRLYNTKGKKKKKIRLEVHLQNTKEMWSMLRRDVRKSKDYLNF